jgi:hypothetical protein
MGAFGGTGGCTNTEARATEWRYARRSIRLASQSSGNASSPSSLCAIRLTDQLVRTLLQDFVPDVQRSTMSIGLGGESQEDDCGNVARGLRST